MALGVEPGEVWPTILIGFVDELTEAHLVTLQFLDDPEAVLTQGNLKGQDRPALLERALGFDRDDLGPKILSDLDQRGLTANVGALLTPGTGTTNLGKRLLRFIKDPTLED